MRAGVAICFCGGAVIDPFDYPQWKAVKRVHDENEKTLSHRERAAEGQVRGTTSKYCYLWYPSPPLRGPSHCWERDRFSTRFFDLWVIERS